MGCNNNNWNGGCTYFDPAVNDENLGCDDEGNCLVENDEAPSDGCTYYESDGDDDFEDPDDIAIEFD